MHSLATLLHASLHFSFLHSEFQDKRTAGPRMTDEELGIRNHKFSFDDAQCIHSLATLLHESLHSPFLHSEFQDKRTAGRRMTEEESGNRNHKFFESKGI